MRTRLKARRGVGFPDPRNETYFLRFVHVRLHSLASFCIRSHLFASVCISPSSSEVPIFCSSQRFGMVCRHHNFCQRAGCRYSIQVNEKRLHRRNPSPGTFLACSKTLGIRSAASLCRQAAPLPPEIRQDSCGKSSHSENEFSRYPAHPWCSIRTEIKAVLGLDFRMAASSALPCENPAPSPSPLSDWMEH